MNIIEVSKDDEFTVVIVIQGLDSSENVSNPGL
jgi:hypothetical protein